MLLAGQGFAGFGCCADEAHIQMNPQRDEMAEIIRQVVSRCARDRGGNHWSLSRGAKFDVREAQATWGGSAAKRRTGRAGEEAPGVPAVASAGGVRGRN